jgi:hypothetical protein
MDAIRHFLDQCCLGTLMPKEMYPHLDTFNQVFLLPAVKLFMMEGFMISADQRSYIADMDFEELAETALEWWPWQPVFKMWQRELTSLSALWKTVSRKSGVSVGKFRRDMEYLLCFLGFIKRDDLIEVLIAFIYMDSLLEN